MKEDPLAAFIMKKRQKVDIQKGRKGEQEEGGGVVGETGLSEKRENKGK